MNWSKISTSSIDRSIPQQNKKPLPRKIYIPLVEKTKNFSLQKKFISLPHDKYIHH